MKLKITKTLIESWAYTFSCHEDYAEEAYNDFLKTLNREGIEPTDAIKAGWEFENLCYRIANGEKVVNEVLLDSVNPVTGEVHETREYPRFYDGAKKVADIITGAQFQVPVSCDLQVAGQDFWLYGICDAVKAGVIYDVKFRMKSLGSDDVYGKYLDCSQHPLYLKALPEAFRFEYLVSDGTDLYVEKYNRQNSKPIEEHIMNFWAWLHTKPELMKIYQEKWVVDG